MVTKLIGQFFGSNTYIINNENQVLLIDAGASVEEIKKYTVGKTVVGVLLTHLHFDHSYNLCKILSEFGCNAYVSELAKTYLSSPDLTLGEAFGKQVELPSNFIFFNNETLKIGNFCVQTLLSPGHSPDSACFLIGSILFSGDTVFSDAIGRTDFKLSSIKDMLNSLTMLKKVKFDVVLSGHGKQSDYFNQQKNIDYFIELLNQFVK